MGLMRTLLKKSRLGGISEGSKVYSIYEAFRVSKKGLG